MVKSKQTVADFQRSYEFPLNSDKDIPFHEIYSMTSDLCRCILYMKPLLNSVSKNKVEK